MQAVLKAAVTSFVGRIILAAYTLVVVPLLPAFINFMNTTLGYSLTDAQVSSYATKASVAIAGLAGVWLLNNGLFERAAVVASSVFHPDDKK